MALTDLTLLELAEKLASGQTSSVEATRASLARVAQVDGTVKAFLRLDERGALAAAEASDKRRAAGNPLGPLDGVPVAVKDNFLTEGVETTCASRVLQGFVPPYDATAVTLLKQAGMPIVGKLNQDEFAMGSSNESSAYGPCHNPWDLERTPGGSSGGSAAALAAREVFGTLGTDTGGSIRQPAALTNTVGLKPTYGRVSRYGVIAYASSLDAPGPMGRTVGDVAALLEVLARQAALVSTSAAVEVPDYRADLERGVAGLKLGVPREYFVEGMDPEVEAAVREALRTYERLGATLVDVSLPHTKYALASYYLLAPAEASSNLSRYDGVRYGFRAREGKGLKDMYGQTRDQGFGAEVKRRIMLGTYALSAGFYDAYYVQAQKVRTLIREDFTKAFTQVDALLTPTSPVPAFKLGEKVNDPLSMYLIDVCTLPCNLAGLPGLSLPCGFTRAGLPVGLQLMGRPFDEAMLLRIARAFEREHDYTRRLAPL